MMIHKEQGLANLDNGLGGELKRKDFIIVAFVLVAAIVIWISQALQGSDEKGQVIVTVAGELYGHWDLDEQTEIKINETNLLNIEEGLAKVVWADCPDQICVHHRPIHKRGESIICLPNRVVVTVEEAEQEWDAMTR